MRGSINVTNSGKAEKVIVPTATVDNCMDPRNAHQCSANITPAKISSAAFSFAIRMLCLFIRIYKPKEIEENNTLPNVMHIAGKWIHLANNPANPNNRTAKLTQMIARFFIFSHQIRIVQYLSKDEFIILIICDQPSQAPQSLHPLHSSLKEHSSHFFL